MASPSRKLTLICPTYKRESFLKRSVDFWAGKPFDIIYVDGSPEASNIDFTGFENLRYIFDPSPVYNRLERAAGLISTPYACMIGDDEYLVPSALQECIDFLHARPSHSSCMGRALGFNRRGDRLVFFDAYSRLQDRKLIADSPMQRLSDHLSRYEPAHCYAVTRTSVWKRAIELASKNQFNVFSIGEIQIECVIVALGKSEVLPILYWLRSCEAPPSRNTGDPSLDPSKTFEGWWRNPTTISVKQDFLESLAEACGSYVDCKELEITFDRYVANYSPKLCSVAYLRSIKTRVFRKIKLLFGYFLPSITGNPLAILRKQGVHVDAGELQKCFDSIKASWQP